MTTEFIETLIVGGGQSGLAMSHMLSKRGRPHLVLERHRIAERWRSERWDSLRHLGPQWSTRLPDFPLPHDDPDGFATARQTVSFLEAYADLIAAPVRTGVEVTALRRGTGHGFTAETPSGVFEADNVVVATGPFQRPVVPDLLPEGSGIFQVHASGYRNPEQLPPGAVLVVGGGTSGAQIAEELRRGGRQVFLSIGRHNRSPRRYRGKDYMWWLAELGLEDVITEGRALPPPHGSTITGAYGGYTIDFRRFAADGMVLLGRAGTMTDGVMSFDADLPQRLSEGDTRYTSFLDLVDAHVARAGLDLPDDPDARIMMPDTPELANPPRFLDFREKNINAVVWATGYRLDFSWIDGPVFDADGAPIHRSGITGMPGLYFLGLRNLHSRKSSFLHGVGDDAARLADHIVARAG